MLNLITFVLFTGLVAVAEFVTFTEPWIERAQPSGDAIHRMKARCPFAGPAQDPQLVSHEQGLCDRGASTAGAHQFRDGG